MYIIGIDPGPLPGVVRLQLAAGPKVVDAEARQVPPDQLTRVLDVLTDNGVLNAIALERFVVGYRAARSSTPAAGARTRNMIGEVEAWAKVAEDRDLILHTRSAAEVKPWATNTRLEALRLVELTRGMRHARDAARHALYCAVRDYGLPDPLSRGKYAAVTSKGPAVDFRGRGA